MTLVFNTDETDNVIVFGFHLYSWTSYCIAAVVILGCTLLQTGLKAFQHVSDPRPMGCMHLVHSILHAVEVFLSYALMLLVGTMNLWLALAVILSCMVAYFMFWWMRVSKPTAGLRRGSTNGPSKVGGQDSRHPEAVELLNRYAAVGRDHEADSHGGASLTAREDVVSEVEREGDTREGGDDVQSRPLTFASQPNGSHYGNGHVPHGAVLTLSGSNPALYETSTDSPLVSPSAANPILETFRLPPLTTDTVGNDKDSLLPVDEEQSKPYVIVTASHGGGALRNDLPPPPPPPDDSDQCFETEELEDHLDDRVPLTSSTLASSHSTRALLQDASKSASLRDTLPPPPPPPPDTSLKFSPEFFRKYPVLSSFNRRESDSVASSMGEDELEKAIRQLGS